METDGRRADYDQIAELYDRQPYRAKDPDPDLLAFLAERDDRPAERPSVLDIGCGTGNQLVANRAELRTARMVGLDRFHGMLRRASSKGGDVGWVQGDGAALPFQERCFDFVSNQFAFHHVTDKAAMLADVLRVLRRGGRFVMRNICPREMRNWAIYRYFPAALERDLTDFLAYGEIKTRMLEAGFDQVNVQLHYEKGTERLDALLETVGRRDTCSQLIALPDAAYRAGVERVRADLVRAQDDEASVPTELCLVAIVGDV